MFTPLLKHRAWTVFYLFVFGFTRASLFDKYEQRHAFFYFFGEDYEKKVCCCCHIFNVSFNSYVDG